MLDYADQIYGREITVSFVRRLRDVTKFPDADALVSAISQDVLHTREILATIDPLKIKPVIEMGKNEIEV